MDATVGFLAGDSALASRYESLARERGVKCLAAVSSPEGYVKAVRDLEAKGAEVIVAPLWVKHQLQGHFLMPLVALSPGPYDLLAALTEARFHGTVIGLLHFGSLPFPTRPLGEALAIDLRELRSGRSREAIAGTLKDAIAEGIQAVVTGGKAAGIAKGLGLPSVEVGLGQEALADSLDRALEVRAATNRLSSRLRRLIETFPATASEPGPPVRGLVAKSPAMQTVSAYLRAMSGRCESIIFTGEPGSGRRYLARHLHKAGPRRHGPFLELACNGCSAGEIEEKVRAYMEEARGGVLFLEDLHTFPLSLQVAGEIEGRRPRGDGAVVFASWDSATPARDGMVHTVTGFTHSLRVPPLRQRVEDIPLLFESLVREAASSPQALSPFIERGFLSEEGWEILRSYSWPGNVKELKQVAFQYVTMSLALPLKPLSTVEEEILKGLGHGDPGKVVVDVAPLEDMVDQILRVILAKTGGNRSEVARKLSISRTTLWKRLKKKEARD